MAFQGPNIPAQISAEQAARKAVLDAYNAARTAAGETPNVVQSADDLFIGYDHETGAEIHLTVASFGGVATAGGGSGVWVVHDDVRWLWYSNADTIVGAVDPNMYVDGVLTATVNGAIPTPVVDGTGVIPSIVPVGEATNVADGVRVGDRVFWGEDWNGVGHHGIYVVTSVGSVSTPWSLTRADDHAVSSLLLPFYVEVEGTQIVIRSIVRETDPTQLSPVYLSGSNGSTAIGAAAISTGHASSFAIGSVAVATGDAAFAVGGGAVATGDQSSAFGAIAKATGLESTALGFRAEANGEQSVAIGFTAVANEDHTLVLGAPTYGAVIFEKSTSYTEVGGSVLLDFDTGSVITVSFSSPGPHTFTTANEAQGRSITVFISGGANETVIFPVGWEWFGPKPASVFPNSTRAMLSLCSVGDVIRASIAFEPGHGLPHRTIANVGNDLTQIWQALTGLGLITIP